MKKVIITTGIVAVAGGLATVLLTPSCNADCDVKAKPSVIIQLVGEPGEHAGINYVAGDEVTYDWTTADGSKLTKAAECLDDDCNEWGLGDGQDGTFDVHVTVCGQQFDKSVTVDLNEDGCEVDTQIVQVTVGEAACKAVNTPELDTQANAIDDVRLESCTLEARPSVLASVMAEVDGRMIPVHADRVAYVWDGEPNGRELLGTCINENCSQFAAGLEQTGAFTLSAEVCGNIGRATTTVVKTQDGCHVDTQSVVVVVDASGCKEPPVYQPVPGLDDGKCEPRLVPSAILFPVTDGGDVLLPHPTESLMYIHDNERDFGYCVETAGNGKCAWWITDWGHTGRFKAFTETCERQSSVAYTVELDEEGCYPKTAFVPVFVDTSGCIRPATPKGSDTPKGPGDILAPTPDGSNPDDVNAPGSERPSGPKDITPPLHEPKEPLDVNK